MRSRAKIKSSEAAEGRNQKWLGAREAQESLGRKVRDGAQRQFYLNIMK